MRYRYYSILRPIGPGTFPKKGLKEFQNFDNREFIKSINHEAWGWLDYEEELPEGLARSYDLVRDPEL